MRPIWLIEAGVYHEEADLLLAEIRRQGMIGGIIPYAIMPGVEAIRQSDWLFSVFGGGEEEVFARPAGCHKLFVGRSLVGIVRLAPYPRRDTSGYQVSRRRRRSAANGVWSS